MSTRADVKRQVEHDKNWPNHAAEVLLATRLRALGEARRKHAEGDPEAVYAMRQSLVDIAPPHPARPMICRPHRL